MEENKSKDQKSKQRLLSPSFKKGAIINKKDEEKELKLELLVGGDEEEKEDRQESPSPNKNHQQENISDIKEENHNQVSELRNNLLPMKNSNEQNNNSNQYSPIDIRTNAVKGGHIKNLFSESQAGKAEDGFTKVNQDSKLVIQNEYNLDDFNIFAVLDGHGTNGHFISNFARRYFTAFFKKNKKLNTLKSEDKVYYRLKKNNFEIIRKVFQHVERDLGKSGIDCNISGTTCVMVFQIGEKIICANVGDSRGIIVKNGSEKVLSIDQKPIDPEEQKRITEHGGRIAQIQGEDGESIGPFRVWKGNENYPGIAMSRSIGDFIATTLGVIPEPLFIEETIDKDTQFIVIASDGIWEFLENKKVADIVMPYYKKNDPEGATKKLIKKATDKWNKEDIVVDDITVITIFF